MILSEQELRQINAQLDEVIARGPEMAIPWLRGAFHAHKSQIAHLLAELREIRQSREQ